jgi:hypothetical protein
MKTRISFLAALALLLGTYTSAIAGPAPHDAATGGATTGSDITSRMRIQPNSKENGAKLLIPRAVFQQLKAEIEGNAAPVVGATSSRLNLTGTQTVMTGIFLSLALAFGGVWLVRSRKHSEKVSRGAIAVMVLAICGAVASIAYANAGPPPVARSLTSKILVPDAQPYGVFGEVKVSVVDDSNQIVLVLPSK